ncbi:MAG: radical SAM protein [Planctomycetales bacterium]|nr:radical SAM protein [Planctomycetales bacterium]
MAPVWINVADRVPRTEAEGPGARYAIWVQGCPLRCPGCCNPEMLEFRPAERIEAGALAEEILRVADIEGVTLLGGEPFAQAPALGAMAERVREAGLSVMAFSGFTLEQLREREDAAALLSHVDLLVDGPYLEGQAVHDRRWIGSANQRVHFLTPRYRALANSEQGWDRGPNTIELRMVDGELQVNGFPTETLAALARQLAKRQP